MVVGTICYFLLYGYITSNYANSHWILKALHDWYVYLMIIDTFSVGIIYRSYYGRSIINEVGDDRSGRWDYQPETHKYYKSDLAIKEDYFRNKMDKLDQAEGTLNQLEDQVEQYQETNKKLEKIDQLEENINELDMAIRYAPGSDIALQAQSDFETRAAEQSALSDLASESVAESITQ